MHLRHLPTVRQLPRLRRLVAGGLLAGAVAAGAPAVAGAQGATLSKCNYDAPLHRVTLTDNSGANTLRIFRAGDLLAVQDAGLAAVECRGPSGAATVTNTDKILVDSPGGGALDSVGEIIVDQSAGPLGPGNIVENDGSSEIEVQVRYAGTTSTPLTVIGTPQDDVIKVGDSAKVLLGTDPDVDISMIHVPSQIGALPSSITVLGGDGADVISGRGGHPVKPGAAIRTLVLNGQGGDDSISGGLASDQLDGGPGNDSLFTFDGIDGTRDTVHGGPGFDGAVMDAGDFVFSDVESRSGGVVIGKLKLSPAVVRAEAGGVARASLSWTHPKAWKALRSVEWRLLDGTRSVGAVAIKPRTGRMNADGDVSLAKGARVGHKGKTVTAKLAVRLPQSLAGKRLRVDVQAKDRKGRTQLEPDAGLLRVAR